MSDEVASPGEPFDLEKIKQLIELMEQHGLSEVSLRRGAEQWRLRRGAVGAAVPMYAPMPMPAPQPMPPSAAPSAVAPERPAEEGRFVEIKSPTVGTFYASPSPEDPAFVTVGTQVNADTIVCLIEAMKVFNQIPAEVSGTITAVLVNSGDAVEFGQPLFRVRQ